MQRDAGKGDEAVRPHVVAMPTGSGLPARVEPDELVVLSGELVAQPARRERFWLSLTPDERARVERYHFVRDRERALVSRGVLREVLGHLLGLAPGRVELSVGAHGKPALVGAHDLAFNVSHSEQRFLVALGRARALGVDIEGGERGFDVDSLAKIVFTDGERAQLARFRDDGRRAAFLRAWTRKEAYLKARSVGLSLPLTDFSVSLDIDAGIISSTVDPVEAARFGLAVLPTVPTYEAAVAWERTSVPVRVIRVGRVETE